MPNLTMAPFKMLWKPEYSSDLIVVSYFGRGPPGQ